MHTLLLTSLPAPPHAVRCEHSVQWAFILDLVRKHIKLVVSGSRHLYKTARIYNLAQFHIFGNSLTRDH